MKLRAESSVQLQSKLSKIYGQLSKCFFAKRLRRGDAVEYTLRDLEKWNDQIEQIAAEEGLDCYEQDFEIIGYKDMLSYEAYIGMPSRYPHWSFGKAYEKNRTFYKYNLTGLPYEMVINSNPCLAYLMRENTMLLQILTIAHVYGHNDFFKNNRLFKEGTQADYTVEMFKRHANLVRSYINDPSIGYQNVERLLDAAHAIKLQLSRVVGERRVSNDRIKQSLLDDYKKKSERRSLLEPYVKPDFPDINKIPLQPEEDILHFITQYGELEEWERNILEIVREETAYFIPQIETKIMNEGWASYWHYHILQKLKLPDDLQLEFLKRHNDVVAPRVGGLNPYYLGFKIFLDIERRFGRDKIFEVRTLERDESFIRRYLTKELCNELNLFEYAKKGYEYIVEEVADDEGWHEIRNTLCSSCGMGMVPAIRIIDMCRKNNVLTMEHVFDGRELNMEYAEATIKHIFELWGYPVILKTNLYGREVKLVCDENKKVTRN
jgi:stage V sporulation protein R